MVRWGDSTIATFLESLNAALNWAVRSELISKNPIKDYKGPKHRSRSRDCIVSPELHQRILNAAQAESSRRIIQALEQTGARPSELIEAKGCDWSRELGGIVYFGNDRRREDEFRHKTAHHKKDRVILFSGELRSYCEERALKNPNDALFPSRKDAQYKKKSLVSLFRALRPRIGEDVTPYSYRHTFATNWLLAGKSIEILAEILGNSANTIRKHYAHLCSDRNAIRAHLEDFRKGTAVTG